MARPFKNKDLIHEPPKFKKGDVIKFHWSKTNYEFYQINGVRSSRYSGLMIYLTKMLKVVGAKYGSNFEKPYNYIIDHRSSLASRADLKLLKKAN